MRQIRLIIAAFIVTMPFAVNADPILAENGAHAGYNVIPFGGGAGPGRYQQVYSADLFGGATTINSIAFSPELDGTYSADIIITLSSTTAAVGSLSDVLVNNVTGTETVVLSEIGFSQVVVGGAELFSLIFDITDYFYDGINNLLVDISIENQAGPFGYSQAVGSTSVYSRAYDNTTFGTGADNGGLRTLFDVSSVSVPEPGTLALLGIGLFGMGLARRRKKF